MLLQYDVFDQHIGRTNAVLSEDEVKLVKARLYCRRQQFQNVNNFISNPQAIISNHSELRDYRAKVYFLIKKYEVALAPHKKLPVELWQHIFQYVFSGYDLCGPNVMDPPLLLCRVCSSWRNIALNMRELWSTLHFYVEKAYTPEQKLQATQSYFCRAGQQKRSLTLSDTSDTFPPINFVQEVVVPYSRTFRYLHLVLPGPQIKELLALPIGSLDMVEELHVVLYIGLEPADAFPAWKPHITVFGPSSRLRRLRIQLTAMVDPQIFHFHFPWHRLETFRCDSSLECKDCHTLLVSCQSLRQLHVRICNIRYATGSFAEIPLSNLTHLNVLLCDQENYDYFFLPLILPSLRSLMIYKYDGLPWSQGMYNGLLERSKCKIEDLYLGTLNTSSRDLVRIFQLTPTLRSLTISPITNTSAELLRWLASCEVGVSLEQLFLKGSRILTPLLTMLETRQSNLGVVFDAEGRGVSASSLKFLQTHAIEDITEEIEDRIERLRDVGVHVSLLREQEGYYQL